MVNATMTLKTPHHTHLLSTQSIKVGVVSGYTQVITSGD